MNITNGEKVYGISITTNPYQGLKLESEDEASIADVDFNYYKSLSGIETDFSTASCQICRISITTNPYQGLKPILAFIGWIKNKISITTNPYQGLKHR